MTNVVIPHTQRPSLFYDEYETLTPEATGLYMAFECRVKEFIKEYHLEHRRQIELEYLLTSVIHGICSETRIRQNTQVKRLKKEAEQNNE